MAVHSNTDVQATTDNILNLPESILKKLVPNQLKLVQALSDNYPHGLLSNQLTRETGISNKSDLIDNKLKLILFNEGLKIHITRVSKQWLWSLRQIKDMGLTEQRG